MLPILSVHKKKVFNGIFIRPFRTIQLFDPALFIYSAIHPQHSPFTAIVPTLNAKGYLADCIFYVHQGTIFSQYSQFSGNNEVGARKSMQINNNLVSLYISDNFLLLFGENV